MPVYTPWACELPRMGLAQKELLASVVVTLQTGKDVTVFRGKFFENLPEEDSSWHDIFLS